MTSHTTETGRMLIWAVVLSAGVLTSACSWVPKGESTFDAGMKDRGVASWYGAQFHGRQAANGELFNMEALTAAHRTIPLGSIVRVVNLENGKSVHVRINDRGPYVGGRILDLSRGAAGQLGMVEGGLSHVQIEVVGDRRLDVLLSSEARPTLSMAVRLQPDQVDVAGIHSSRSNQPDQKVLPPTRFYQGDAWFSRRSRRVTAILAADHAAHTEMAALVFD